MPRFVYSLYTLYVVEALTVLCATGAHGSWPFWILAHAATKVLLVYPIYIYRYSLKSSKDSSLLRDSLTMDVLKYCQRRMGGEREEEKKKETM